MRNLIAMSGLGVSLLLVSRLAPAESIERGTIVSSGGITSATILFVGQRRGGRACTAGICYDVLPLDGGEMRWTMRF